MTDYSTVDVLEELKNNFGLNKVKDHGTTASIICPFHNNGQERTPSMVVNFQKEPIGWFFCFACQKQGPLSKLLNCEFDFEETSSLSINFDGSSLKENKKGPSKKWKTWPKWPKNRVWRTIPGWTVRALGGRVETPKKFGERLCLPVMQFGINQGNIHCALYKSKLAYVYDKHSFVKTSLFGFDYAEKLLRKSKTKTLFVVEGPRDTARFASVYLPTVGTMGGMWGQEKWDLIEYLNPNQLIIATDPDTVGDKLAKAIKESCGDSMRVGRLPFETKHDKNGKVIYKEDPGNLSELKLAILAKKYQ